MSQVRNSIAGSIPPVTLNILITTVICWVAQLLLGNIGSFDFTDFFGLHFFMADSFHPHQLVTYMFMHATYDEYGNIIFTHILFNMFAVFMFGRTLEMVWGGKRFLFYYIATGIGAAIVQELTWVYEFREVIFNPEITKINIGTSIVSRSDFWDLIPLTVGASGAVFGILIAFGMLFPNVELMLFPIPIPIKAKYFVAMYGGLELFLGVSGIARDNVAHFAHLGGLFVGFLIVLYWKKKNKNNGRFY